MRARHILLNTPLLIDEIKGALDQGADFSLLAREHSVCPSAEKNGDWGLLTANELPDEIVNALQDAAIADIVGPVKTQHGYHLIKIESL